MKPYTMFILLGLGFFVFSFIAGSLDSVQSDYEGNVSGTLTIKNLEKSFNILIIRIINFIPLLAIIPILGFVLSSIRGLDRFNTDTYEEDNDKDYVGLDFLKKNVDGEEDKDFDEDDIFEDDDDDEDEDDMFGDDYQSLECYPSNDEEDENVKTTLLDPENDPLDRLFINIINFFKRPKVKHDTMPDEEFEKQMRERGIKKW